MTKTPPKPRQPTAGRPSAKRSYKIALVGSSGGHLAHLLALKPFWRHHDRFWVTFNSQDAVSQLVGERVYWCYHPTNRHIPNLLRNTVLALRLMRRERPNLIVSTGAGAAIPYFWLAPLFGAKSAFIEVADRLDRPSLTGQLVSPIATSILVQWPEQRRLYARATIIGPLL